MKRSSAAVAHCGGGYEGGFPRFRAHLSEPGKGHGYSHRMLRHRHASRRADRSGSGAPNGRWTSRMSTWWHDSAHGKRGGSCRPEAFMNPGSPGGQSAMWADPLWPRDPAVRGSGVLPLRPPYGSHVLRAFFDCAGGPCRALLPMCHTIRLSQTLYVSSRLFPFSPLNGYRSLF